MGDPTLRMHPVVPPSELELLVSDGNVELTWIPSTDEGILGYKIYRSSTLNGQFENLLPDDVITSSNWMDTSPRTGNNVYMIRACKLESTGSGTYFNLSLGIIDSTFVSCPEVEPIPPGSDTLYQSFPNPFSASAVIRLFLRDTGAVSLTVFDINGRAVSHIIEGEISEGFHSFEWMGMADNGSPLGNGIYFVRLASQWSTFSRALIILR